MNPLKRLASQTAVYGVSSVVGRFLNYLLVPLYTYTFAPAEYGVVAEFYAYMGFLAVLLTFGLETGYFRFRAGGEQAPDGGLRHGAALSGVGQPRRSWSWPCPASTGRRPRCVTRGTRSTSGGRAAILALDSIGAVAFARLRAENRALRFASVKVIEIAINIGLNLIFILGLRAAFESDPESFLGRLWDSAIGDRLCLHRQSGRERDQAPVADAPVPGWTARASMGHCSAA